MAGYFRRFVPNFAKISRCLYTVASAGQTPFKWTTECQEAFETLKLKLSTPPILKLYDANKPIHLFTDASRLATGYVLMQEHDNRLHPVVYGSKVLNKHQRDWSITELEAYGIIATILSLKYYIEGNKAILHTDHSALTYIIKNELTDTKVARWFQTLSRFNVEVLFESGATNVIADALSRQIPDKKPVALADVTEELLESQFDEHCLPTKTDIGLPKRTDCSTQTEHTMQGMVASMSHKPVKVAQLSVDPGHLDVTEANVMMNAQRTDPYYARIIDFLEHGYLPENDSLA